MTRTTDARIASVRRLLAAAGIVYEGRADLAPRIAKDTGLSLAGVELGFASLERTASDDDLHALVSGVEAAPRVHVILAANVFVAPLRALALARAASDRVTVRPSPRDPTLTRALVHAAGDPAVAIVEDRDVAAFENVAVHAYGSDATIDAIATRLAPGASLWAHGTGLGVALVTDRVDVAAAAADLAAAVVAFDQRGCLSPRVAFALGGRAEALAAALDEALSRWQARVPRGALDETERAAAAYWRETQSFVGGVRWREGHAVASSADGAVSLPPPGRHVQVLAASSLDDVALQLAPIAPFVVAVGADDPGAAAAIAPPHARISTLGAMQHPPLDGPVDRRPRRAGVRAPRAVPCSE